MFGSDPTARVAWPTRGARRHGRRLALVALCLAVAVGCQASWAQRGYGPGHGGFNPTETALTTSSVGALHVAYDATLPVAPTGEPVVVSGLVVVAGVDFATSTPTAVVSASDAKTGAPKWTTVLPVQAIEVSDVATDDTHVFVLTHADDGAVVAHALAKATGTIDWATTVIPAPSVDGWTTISPVLTVVGTRLVVSGLVSDGPAGALVHEQLAAGLDSTSGALVWTRREVVRDPRGSRVVGIGDGNVAWSYADSAASGTGDAYVTRALGAADGTERWARDAFAGDVAIAAAAADGNRVVGDLGPEGFPAGSGGVLDGVTGSVVWHGAPSGVVPLVVTDDRSVWPLVDGDGLATGLRSFALADGAVQWSRSLDPGVRVRSAVVAGSVLYATTDDGSSLSLRTYDAASGTPIAVVTLADEDASETTVAGPVVVGGRVLVAVGNQLVSLTA